MKRRSRSTPRQTKRASTVPGTPGPFTADLARDQLQSNFPGASPESTKKTAALRKQLFGSHMVKTRQATMDGSSSSSSDRLFRSTSRLQWTTSLNNFQEHPGPSQPEILRMSRTSSHSRRRCWQGCWPNSGRDKARFQSPTQRSRRRTRTSTGRGW